MPLTVHNRELAAGALLYEEMKPDILVQLHLFYQTTSQCHSELYIECADDFLSPITV